MAIDLEDIYNFTFHFSHYRKIFVGGIHRSTTQDGLKHYFEKFGEVKVVKLMIDKETGNSRGFGFVTYADPSCISQVMGSKPHTLDGKIVSCILYFLDITNVIMIS